jgi:hypothetical protein
MLNLRDELLSDESVSNALNFRDAMIRGDYARMFSLYKVVPNLGKWIIDHFLSKERQTSLRAICKAYRPSIPTEVVRTYLGFEDESVMMSFFSDLEIAPTLISSEKKTLDTKSVSLHLS